MTCSILWKACGFLSFEDDYPNVIYIELIFYIKLNLQVIRSLPYIAPYIKDLRIA